MPIKQNHNVLLHRPSPHQFIIKHSIGAYRLTLALCKVNAPRA